MERRLAENPPGCSFENEQPEPLPTLEEAKQSFEDEKRKSLTPEEKEEKEEDKIKQKSTSNHTERQRKQRLWEKPFI